MSQNKLRILIIDDNPDIHRDFIKILTTNTISSENKELNDLEKNIFDQPDIESATQLPVFQIDTASQGQEGVQKIEAAVKEGNHYALSFVDIRMPPGWDGIETVKHIWKIDPDIQIVICTAYSDYSWEETVEHLGQRENLLILKKPFDHVAVRQLTCALTKKWQLMQENRQYTKSLEESVKERTQSLQQSLAVSRGTLESSGDGILVIDIGHHIIDYNNKLIEMWKIPSSIVETKNANLILEYISEQVAAPQNFLGTITNLANYPEIIKIDKLKCKDGRIFEHYSQPYKLNDEIAGRVCCFRDISIRAALEEKLEFQAMHDELTGLPNRVLLADRIHQAIAQANRDQNKFGIIFFDLDRFKLINDSLSHTAGDEVLRLVSKRLQHTIREVDTMARLAGDEFVAVITSLNDENYLMQVISKLLYAFKGPFNVSSQILIISASIGISIFPQDGKDIETLLRNADMAMYRAKELGGNQFQFYIPELNTQSVERLELETELYQAIENNEFYLCYQPQFDLPSEKLISSEALIRWQHPKKGLILPINFIPVAEEMGLITALGEWVLRTACKQNKEWQDAGLPPIRVAVNITTQQFKQPTFVSMIEKILKETGLEAQYLELELTENVIINSIQSAETIAQLKSLGVNIALDDFGTGYSSLNYLRKISIDRLKIDQSFIQNIDINRGDEVIIKALINMARDMNLEIVAEGVETKKQIDFLRSKKCGEIQGYYFSKPLSSGELEGLLKNSSTVIPGK